MKHLLAHAMILGLMAFGSHPALADVDPFANLERPEWTVAQVQALLRVSPPPFTQEDVDRWVAEVRPVVEELAGRRFKEAPIARVVSRDALADAMADQMGEYVRRVVPDATPLQELEFTVQAKAAAANLAPLSFGQYIDGVDEILIPAENYPGMLRLVGHEATSVEEVVKVVLAHELTHALQDQTLGGLEVPTTEDEALAYRATIEGHAIHVQVLAAEALGLHDGHRALLAGMAPARVTGVDPLAAMQQERQQRVYAITYRGGYRYMRRMADDGGMERLWGVLAEPPVAVEEFEEAGPGDGPAHWEWPGEAVVFRAVQDRLAEAQWKRTNQTLSTQMSGILFRDLADAELVRGATQALTTGGLSVWQRTDGQAVVIVTAIRLDDPPNGATMVRAFDEVAKAKHKKMGEAVSASEFHRTDHEIQGCDGASRVSYAITPAPGQSMEMVIINAWRGQNFVSLSDASTGEDVLSEAEAATVIRAVLEAMDEADAE